MSYFQNVRSFCQYCSHVWLVRTLLALSCIACTYIITANLIRDMISASWMRHVGIFIKIAVILLTYFFYVRWIERRKVDELSRRGAGKEFVIGMAVGAGLLLMTIGILYLLGYYQIIGIGSVWLMFLGIPVFVQTAVLEEVIFRGIIFRLLETSIGSWLALLVSAFIFGFMHLNNPRADMISATAIGLEAGLMLGAAYMATRRLWLCIAIHFSWNFVQGGVFSVAVSGMKAEGLLEARMDGPTYLTGGEFGVEASLLAVMFCVLMTLYWLRQAYYRKHIIQPWWSKHEA